MLAFLAVLMLRSGSAEASFYKTTMCAQSNDASGAVFTASSGAFHWHNQCPSSPNFPAGDQGFIRIWEDEPGGGAAVGAFGRVVLTAPHAVAIAQAGGYTREPLAFNDGWRGRFWAEGFDGSQNNILMQGRGVANGDCGGVCWGLTSSFASHLWQFGASVGFYHRFNFELVCVRQNGCDRSGQNTVDANTFVLVLNDVDPAHISLRDTEKPFFGGAWVRGRSQGISWNLTEVGSGLRWERVRVDGAVKFQVDHRGNCNLAANGQEGEFARVFQPCPVGGPFGGGTLIDTTVLSDGAHSVQVCAQDYGQASGLFGSGGESCEQRTVHIDNNAPHAPGGLAINRPAGLYPDKVSARWTLPADSGSPIAKVHYALVDGDGKVVVPEKTVSATNPTQLADIQMPKEIGSYRLRIWLEDAVGFKGPAATVALPRDTTPPAAPQEVSVTTPNTSRAEQGFDVRWQNITDNGSPIDAAHYEVLDATGRLLAKTVDLKGANPQSIPNLETPKGSGTYTLKLWLSDAEGNVGAPVRVPLSYECVRSDVAGGQSLSAGIGEKGERAVVVPQGKGSTLRGSLGGGGGPVANATLCVFARVVTDQPREFLGTTMTGADGSYNFVLPAGPSREVTTMYRGDQRQIAARATIQTRVKPTLKLGRKVVHNHHYATFAGDIPGPHNDQVVVVVQVKDGKGWRAIRRYRTRSNGHYSLKYLFTQTNTATTYLLRTQVRETAGYPFVQGNSRSVRLRVLP